MCAQQLFQFCVQRIATNKTATKLRKMVVWESCNGWKGLSKDLHVCKYRHLCQMIKEKCHQGNLNTIHAHWCCVIILLQDIQQPSAKLMQFTWWSSLPYRTPGHCATFWLLCIDAGLHVRTPNTVLDLGLLVEYCAPHNFDLNWKIRAMNNA